ncbi:hypothetical protein VE00_04572 [Pseudogymnoascus sp. WSF 3629]|nr:hypothetical protein VE00_04572 [Pseudogymnoascus sp. WSF 3629]
MDTSPPPQSHIHTPRHRPHPPSSSTSSPPPTPPPLALNPTPQAPPVDGPSGHNRSTSLTSLKRTFSKILPANRSERGGTRRDSQGQGDVETVDVVEDGRREEKGEQTREKGKIVKDEGRRSRSWSPRKGEVMSSASDDKENGPQKEVDKEPEKGGNAFQRLLGLRRTSLPASSTPAQPSTRRLSLRRPKGKKAIHFASSPTQIPSPTPASRPSTSPSPPLDSQQMYDQKRLRREQRRSYRSSEDYLTIAGANPRTGYWDVNTAIASTSSSEAADRARAREAEIAENRRRLEAAKQELQEALAKREAEDRERDAKRARRRERDEARRREKRGREAGRWRTEGDGWRMVAEPGLSPIVGSLAGSPRMDRTPDDQLTEMRVPEEVVERGDFGRERGRSPEEERRRRLSRSPATPSRLSRQVGDTTGVSASSTPMERKALPSASRVVSGDIPLYVAPPSKKGGSSRKLSSDRVPELQPGLPSPSLEKANPGRAAIFPSPRRQPHRPPFIDTTPEISPQGPRSPAISAGRSGDNRKDSRANVSPNESARRSPDRANHDPFGPIPRRRPASPPKAVNTPRPADMKPAVETPRPEESTPVRHKDAEPEAQRAEQHTPAVVSSGAEAENRELEGSNDTIVHHSIAEALPEALPVDDRQRVSSPTPKDLNEREAQTNPEQSPFLGIRPDGQPEEPATATSSQSASTSPALTPRQSHQSLKDTDQGKRIKHIASMNELPPFMLKHPVTGTSLPIAPSSPKILAEVTNRISKEMIGGDGKAASTTTTTTITPTTGSAPVPLQLDQMDGSFDQKPSPKRRPTPLSRIPAPQVSPQSARNHLPSAFSPRRATGSDTSSAGEAGATPTKRRIPRWYQKLLPGFGREVEKSTHTSTSTSPGQTSTSPRYHRGDPGGHPGAQNAARVALLNGDKALSPDRGVQGQTAGVGVGVGAHGGSPGGGNVGMSRMGSSPVRIERGDKLVVWHAAPVVGPRRRHEIPEGDEIKKHVGTVTPNASATPNHDTSPPGGATLQQVLIVLLSTARHLILAAWCFVEPVFDPRSALRARWERQEMTWRDGVVVVGAGVFGAAALLAAVLGVRVVGGVVRVVGVVGRGCRFLMGG